ncbi:MAG: SurA N-terminal domain-containing protein [Acidobacteria bacterium]|nr:SurA N-terminal domain-containing protein [Acidobacteriota bacterium]
MKVRREVRDERDVRFATTNAPSAPRRVAAPPREESSTRRACARFVALLVLPCAFCFAAQPARGQEVVDKMVATINGRELVTYTDLLWQLALQPDTPLDNPRAEDLRQALDRLIDQRLIAEESGRLPTVAPSDKDVADAQTALIKRFPSQAAFYARIARVGLSADQFREIVTQRLEIERYLDFRFRDFVVVAQKEIADYYRDTYAPRFRRQHPGVIVPTLEQASAQIEQTLTEAKVESDTDAFLDDARSRADVVILDPALAKS